MSDSPVYVTQPSLPPLKEFVSSLEKIWESKHLTNGGPYHQELEAKLANYLGVPFISLTSNGDAALLAALKSMNLSGEVITTPYSFVSTTHSIIWNDLTPVFVDIDPDSGNIDAKQIEAAITDKTSAILAVHCYGFPCDVQAIESIAKKHDLKVIYDAAHAFGVRSQSDSILNYGDAAILSFHATKVFNTFEGGAIISHSKEQKEHIDRIKNFGIANPENIPLHGLNAKMSEVNAAFGVLQLNYVGRAIEKRKSISDLYCSLLSNVAGIDCMNATAATETHNYAYFPIVVSDDYKCSRNELFDLLSQHKIMSRKYFYPLLSNTQTYREYPTAAVERLPHANDLADHVLCLPIYEDLNHETVTRICNVIAA